MISREQGVGLFFIGGILLFVLIVELTVGTGLFRDRYTLYADFHDVQGLAAGADVRVAGVSAGTVSGVELGEQGVRVALAIDDGIVVLEDAVARLDFQALSGTRFVAIDLGSRDATALESGATVGSEEPAGISEMIDELKGVATSVRALSDSLNENQEILLTNLNAVLEENRETLALTLQNVNVVTEKLASGQGTLGRLLNDSTLYDQAVAALETMNESFGDIRQVTRRLAAGEGLLGRLLAEEDELYDDLRETLASLHSTAENFEQISDQVRLGEGTLGRLLVDDGLYVEAEDALRGVTRATQGIEDQAPISVLGTFIGTIF